MSAGKNSFTSWAYANNAYATCAIPPNADPVEGSDYSPGWWPNTAGFRNAHPGGLHLQFVGGATRWISDEIQPETYRALATIQGEETVQLAD